MTAATWPRCECGKLAHWWAAGQMHMPPQCRIPMCDDIRDLIQAYADEYMQFVPITDDNRGRLPAPTIRKDKRNEHP